MQVKELKSEKLYKEFAVTIPAEEMIKRIDQRLSVLGKKVKIDGFRPGKVPMKVLQQRYGDSVRGEVLEQAVNDTSAKVLSDKKIKAAMQPTIEVKKFDADNIVEFTLGVATMPEFTPAPYDKIEIERPMAKVSDKEINKALTEIADSNKEAQPIKAKRAAKNGDILKIDFDGSVDGEKKPGMQSEGHELELGSKSFIEGFEDQLVGKKAGDDVTVTVKFPDDYHGKEVAGKNAVFEVKIHDICEAVTPKMDDDFAKKLGVESFDKLKELISERMQSEFDQMSQSRTKRNLLDALDKANKFDVPEQMVENEYNNIWNAHMQDIKARGLDEKKAEKDKDSQKEFREIAGRRVRLGILMAKIGEENKVQVSPQELQAALQQEAMKYRGQEQQVYEYYQSNPQAIQALQAPVYEGKVADLILEKVKIKDKEISGEDLAKDPDDEKEEARLKKMQKK